MRKVLLTLLGILLAIGLLAGAGFAGYRLGYARGVRASAIGNVRPFNRLLPFGSAPFHDFRQFDRDFGSSPRFGPGRLPMRPHYGFGWFGFLPFVGRIAIWGLILWFIFRLFTKSGWQLTRVNQPANAAKESPAASESPKTEE